MYSISQQLVADFIGTFALIFFRSASVFPDKYLYSSVVLVVFATAVDEKGAFKAISGFGIGLTITLGILVAGPLTGAAMNPARAFGPALAATYWAHHGIYWIGPLAGGFLAGLLYDSVF